MTIKELKVHISSFNGNLNLQKWPKKVLWGVAPTGPVHFGYAPYLGLLRLFSFHGAEIILLIANYHGFLDSKKTQLADVFKKTKAYKKSFTDVGVPKKWLIETNDFYFTPSYFKGLIEFTSHIKIKDAFSASGKTLRSAASQKTIGDIFYVATQIYDIQHLGIDCVICGKDEAGIYEFGLPALSAITGLEIDYVYLPMAPGLKTEEMHASDDPSNKLLIGANPLEIASAFNCSTKFREFHDKFTLPLLNYQSRELPTSIPEDVFKLIRDQ